MFDSCCVHRWGETIEAGKGAYHSRHLGDGVSEATFLEGMVAGC